MNADLIAFFRRAFLRHGPRRYAVMQPRNADRKYDDYPGQLTDRQIAAHLEGRSAFAVPYVESGLGNVLAFDIDAGGIVAATALLDAAHARGLWAFAIADPAQVRGYVWVPFDDLTSGERLKALGDLLLTEVRPEAHAWRIENRASEADTRLPFARHAWTGQRGILITQNNLLADLDTEGRLGGILDRFVRTYRENPTDLLPPPPAPQSRSQERPAGPQGHNITIASYNASTDLVQLLEQHGAKRARGQGARLYFCPFHDDAHASLILSKDGQRCHCYSTGSECPLSGHQYDAFNVFCIGEGLTTAQALRRLNGHPDDPSGSAPPKTRPQAPPAGPGNAERKNTTQGPGETFAAVRASKQAQRTPLPAPPKTHTQASDGRRLPKSARRVLDYLARSPGDYCRGKYHLADQLDIDPRTVQRSLRRLETEGLITRLERGHDGQTDIYRLASVSYDTKQPGGAYRVDTHSSTAPEQGRQLPPTLEHESNPNPKALKAERGGTVETASPPPTGDGQDDPGPEGTARGPGGAVAYPGGAAYVPPQALTWYGALPAEVRGEREGQEEPPAPEQIELASPAHELATPTPRPAQPKKRRTRYVDPGHLHGRIIAATRKAEKLEASGKAKDRAQAKAIRRSAEQMQRQLEALREAPPSGIEGETDAEDWAPTPPTAPPSSSFFGLDWAYLERLYRAGEQRAIETHCALWRADVCEVCAELARARP